ncbi:MAG TPA: hypothetical protein VL285_16975 [Bryobacteraceae bacterium]|nr:hypothetical protein [Bryobacteraceae bacterium]
MDLKNLGSVRLMEIDTSTLFLPFGRPVSDYLLGAAGPQNGQRTLLKPVPADFSPAVRWTNSTAACLRTTGFGELEREGLSLPPATADPAVADFLASERPPASSRAASQEKIAPAVEPQGIPVSKPRISALPLRPRMTFGPPPAEKNKPAPAPPPARSAAPAAPPAAKSAPPPPQQKPAPAVTAKPTPPPKPTAPATVQPKPAAAIPPPPRQTPAGAPKPAAAQPVTRTVSAPPAPAASQPKPSSAPPRASASPRPSQNAAAAAEEPVVVPVKPAAPQPASKSPAAAPAAPKPAPPVPPGRQQASTISVIEQPPAPRPKPEPEPPAPKPAPAREDVAPRPLFEPHLTMGAEAESTSFLERVPLPVKIGLALLMAALIIYFAFLRTGEKGEAQKVSVGEQGWSTEWASDANGSRRGRQITLYRPSTGLGDYQMQFTGQIESKALGWVFRAADTKNYYAMKLENLRPGAMALTHFAVVEGRESSNSQRPLSIDARPGAVYRVKLDVTGPRFTVYIGGEPVDFWTDNRLKAGAVGFMNERDERGATSSVQFSFPKGVK